MKVIIVMYDTLSRRMLPPYGCDWVHAPNFARLAEQTVTFDNCYVGSMPCMPARRELHTGRYNFLHRAWGPLEPFDDSMPDILKQHGVYTHLVSDHQHYWEDGGATYHNRYSSWDSIRGQEGDAWKGHVADPEAPETINPVRPSLARQDWINRSYMPREEDQPQPKVFDSGLEFIRTNHDHDRWMLQIETFDPHEPFFTQQQYKDLYPHAYDGPLFDWPGYQRVSETPEQVQHMRYEYAALISMCDRSLGRVLDVMDELALWDDTMLIVCTDHGFLLGEHGWWAKGVQPWYNEIAHTPLFIWDPRSAKRGERRSSLVQMIDFAPTLLDYFGVDIPPDMQGLPLKDTIAHDQPVRDAGLFGTWGGHVNITDAHYVYMRAPATSANAPLHEYTLMPTRMNRRFEVGELQNLALAEPFSFTKGCQTLKIEGRTSLDAHAFGTMLFDVEQDPQQNTSLVDDAQEKRMLTLLTEKMRVNDAPLEQYERLNLPAQGTIGDEHMQLAHQRPLVEQSTNPQHATTPGEKR